MRLSGSVQLCLATRNDLGNPLYQSWYTKSQSRDDVSGPPEERTLG
jgi:hypothetical protein